MIDSSAPTTAKGKVKPVVGTAKKSSTHPSFIEMVKEAIKQLDEKRGSSKQALLKYICANYDVDAKIANIHIKLALRNGVKNGVLKQPKGIGATGSFKLGEQKVEKKGKPLVGKKSVAKPKEEKATKLNTEAKTKAEVEKKIRPKKSLVKPKLNVSKVVKVRKVPVKAKKAPEQKSKASTGKISSSEKDKSSKKPEKTAKEAEELDIVPADIETDNEIEPASKKKKATITKKQPPKSKAEKQPSVETESESEKEKVQKKAPINKKQPSKAVKVVSETELSPVKVQPKKASNKSKAKPVTASTLKLIPDAISTADDEKTEDELKETKPKRQLQKKATKNETKSNPKTEISKPINEIKRSNRNK